MKEHIKYGYTRTIHDSTSIDVEVDAETGEVVALWFRCAALPFRVSKSDRARADEMRRMYASHVAIPEVLAIDLEVETGRSEPGA